MSGRAFSYGSTNMAKNDTIPQTAQTKILRLAEQERQAQMLVNSTTEQISELHRAIRNNPESEKTASYRRELAFTENTLTVRQTRHRALAGLNANLRRYLERLPADVEIAQCKPTKIKLKDGEDYSDAVDRIRAQITALASEKTRVERSEMTKAERKETIKGWVERQRERAKPFMHWQDGNPIIRFDVNLVDANAPIRDTPAMLCWLMPGTMTKRLCEEIDAAPEGLTMSKEDKAERLKEIGKETLACSREEEAIIAHAETKDSFIVRRVDADPRAVLGLVVRGLWKSKAA